MCCTLCAGTRLNDTSLPANSSASYCNAYHLKKLYSAYALTRMLLSALFGKFSLGAESLLFNNVSGFRRQFWLSCIHTSNLCFVLFLGQENQTKILHLQCTLFLHMVQTICNLRIWSFYINKCISSRIYSVILVYWFSNSLLSSRHTVWYNRYLLSMMNKEIN